MVVRYRTDRSGLRSLIRVYSLSFGLHRLYALTYSMIKPNWTITTFVFQWSNVLSFVGTSSHFNSLHYNRAATWQNQQNECAPSDYSDQPGHPPSLIRVLTQSLMPRLIWVFAGRTVILLVLSWGGSILFSGEVGDWQNYFTEEENEHFDKLVKDHFKDSDWKFTYTL